MKNKAILSVNQYSWLLMIGFGLLLNVQLTHAKTGWCETTTGTQRYEFTYNHTFINMNQNAAGTTIDNAYSWALSGSYPIKCDCTTRPQTLFKAEVPSNLTFHHTSGDFNFYRINNYLAVATKVYIWNQGYVSTPFTNVSNLTDNGDLGCATPSTNSVSGASGSLSLYFVRPFVGQVVIPSTPVVNIYATTLSGSYSGIPVATVYMQGIVTRPTKLYH